MKALYQKLYDQINPADYSHFVAMKGTEYDRQANKLMIIGRAPNGWKSLDCSSSEAVGLDAQKCFESMGFDWIIDRGRGFENGQGYFLSRSSFWRVIKGICSEMNDITGLDRWFESIVWSNIYKVSPKDNGEKGKNRNPDNTLCKSQIGICRDILLKEIVTYKPTHILFITGYDWWFYDSKHEYGVQELFCDCKPEKNAFVEGKARFRNDELDIPVVIACRPERKREADYVAAVINALRGKHETD